MPVLTPAIELTIVDTAAMERSRVDRVPGAARADSGGGEALVRMPQAELTIRVGPGTQEFSKLEATAKRGSGTDPFSATGELRYVSGRGRPMTILAAGVTAPTIDQINISKGRARLEIDGACMRSSGPGHLPTRPGAHAHGRRAQAIGGADTQLARRIIPPAPQLT